MEPELLVLLNELVMEFNEKKHLLNEININIALRFGSIPNPEASRNSNSISSRAILYYDMGFLRQKISHFVRNFSSSEKIYDFIYKNNLWYIEFKSYNFNRSMLNSAINFGIVAGFLCRNFEINNYQIAITDSSFSQASEELIAFFHNDFIETDTYVNLSGLTGEFAEIKMSDGVSIVKADYTVAKIFCILYTNPHSELGELELLPGDYVLKINAKIQKHEFDFKNGGKARLVENEIIAKWINVIILACPGYVKIGKRIQLSKDWPIVFLTAIGPYEKNHIAPFHQIASSPITDKWILKIQKFANILNDVDVTKLDNKIRYAIERLFRAKSVLDINDRIVELSIAFEYLINTDNREVTLQLSLKIIKLVYSDNNDENVYSNIKKFYDLRSKIIHGNNKITINETRASIIDFTEEIIQEAIIRMIELNSKFPYKQIDTALTKSLHMSKTLNELLGIDSPLTTAPASLAQRNSW